MRSLPIWPLSLLLLLLMLLLPAAYGVAAGAIENFSRTATDAELFHHTKPKLEVLITRREGRAGQGRPLKVECGCVVDRFCQVKRNG